MVLDTMTLEELIREIKTDFSEVKGRWKNYVRKFRKTAQKRTMFPWLWEANIKTRRFNEWYISFYAESKKEVGILNPTFTMLFKYKGQLLVGAVTNYGGKNEACQYVVGLKMGDCFGFQSVMVE